MKNYIKRNETKGFTLVELLAVIVILAIILVIAVPKVMSVIEDAKKATLESTAKMIASQAEKQKVQNTVLGNTNAITCKDITNINDVDYASCSITFEDNTAKVKIEGSGKFEGLYVCDGTKTNAVATEEECTLICEYGITDIAVPIEPYEVKNYDSCVSFLSGVYTDTDLINGIPSICNGNGFNDYTTDFIFEIESEIGLYTKQELIENNVIKGTIEKGCLEPTPEECFTFDSETATITGYDVEICPLDVVIPSKINGVDVEVIGNSSFFSLGITSINIPNSVEYIGEMAFRSNEITSINIPNSVEYIGEMAFVNNPLTNVYLNNTSAEIKMCAFDGKHLILNHNLPDSYLCQG